MKAIVKGLLPNKLWESLRSARRTLRYRKQLSANYKYDQLRFDSIASPRRDFSKLENRIAYVVMLYHSLEKGMSLPEPKPGYGQTKAKELLCQIRICMGLNCFNSQVFLGLKVLEAYTVFNEKHGISLPGVLEELEDLKRIFNSIQAKVVRQTTGGVQPLTSLELARLQAIDFESFALSRHSIRDFTSQEISKEIIRRAAIIAQKSPSVCNRQSSRLHVFENNDLGKRLLHIQNGNNGFGHTANKVFIITSDLSTFLSIGERNQCWIDGSLFAMTFIYALHSMGVGTCCLNWSKEKEDDQIIREIAKIRKEESIIMLIAAGYPPENFFVTCSHRSPINDYLYFH